MGHSLRFLPISLLAGALLLAAGAPTQAGFLDDNARLSAAITALRGALGDHPRVLRIEIEADAVAIEAQDPRNRSHVDRWRYGATRLVGVVPVTRLTGPQPVALQLINPDLEANLFDLDAVDFSAAPKLFAAAVARVKLQDPAAVTRVEIARQTFILPRPSSGDVRWTVRVGSAREHAEVYANAQGAIVGMNVGETQRAKTLNLLDEPALAADAAAAFSRAVGTGAVLTAIGIDERSVSFRTNIQDQGMARIGFNLPATASYGWDLSGLHRGLGNFDVSAQMGSAGPPPFSIDDVDWTILAKLEQAALARAAIAGARVKHLGVAKSADQPGGPVLAWTVEIAEPSGEVTKVIADAKGVIQRVVLPASRRPRTSFLDPATIASAIARIGPTFGADARIASIAFDDRGGRVTLDDPSQGGRATTFDITPDSFTRATISFSLDAMGPRFALGDITALTEQTIGALQEEAVKRLGAKRTAYLESVRIGAHPFVRQAGAQAIEIRVRDLAQDSAQANYAWIVFDLNGRVLDFVTF